MTDDDAPPDSPWVRRILDLEEEAARILREAELETAAATVAAGREIEALRMAAQTERTGKVEALEHDARGLLERSLAEAEARHAAALAAANEDCPERREAAVGYLLARLKNVSP